MPIAVDPNKTWLYILKMDRELPVEKRTKFWLRTINVKEEAEIQDAVAGFNPDENRVRVYSGTRVLTILRKGIDNWENLIDEEGNEVLCKKLNTGKRAGITVETVEDESLNWLKPEWRSELVEAIIERNTVTESESGNSSSPQGSSPESSPRTADAAAAQTV